MIYSQYYYAQGMDHAVVEGHQPGGQYGAALRVGAPLYLAGRDLAYFDPSERPLWLEVEGPARPLTPQTYLELYRIWRLYHMLTLMEFETRHIFSSLCIAVHAKRRSQRVPPGYVDELWAQDLLDDAGRVREELEDALKTLTELRNESWTVVNPWPPKD